MPSSQSLYKGQGYKIWRNMISRSVGKICGSFQFYYLKCPLRRKGDSVKEWHHLPEGIPSWGFLSPAFRIQDFCQVFLRPEEPLQLGQKSWFLCAPSPEKLRLIRLRHRISQEHLWPFLPGSEDKVITELQICPRGQSHFRAEHKYSLAPRAFLLAPGNSERWRAVNFQMLVGVGSVPFSLSKHYVLE